MTKSIRVENADTSDWKVTVQVWQVGSDGTPDTMVKELPLNYPTSMVTEYIHSSQYLVIKES